MEGMKRLTQILATTALIGMIALPSVGASGLEYKSNKVDLGFTFTSTMTVELSSTAVTIADLAPGAQAKSNAVEITVNTNDSAGYTLNATVGVDSDGNRVNTLRNSSSGTSFSMIGSAGSLAAGEWGYTVDDGTTYRPIATIGSSTTTVNKTTNKTGSAASGYTGTNSTSFKIGAKAAADQLAGEYTNTINFSVVSNSAAVSGS